MRKKPKRGDQLQLILASVYASPCDKEPTKFCSGSYYLWDDEQKNGRYPITSTYSRCGIHGYISGWIDRDHVTIQY